MEWILFVLLLYSSVPVNAADHDPTASRDSPSSSSVSVKEGNSQSFKVNVQDPDGDLNYVEWYVNGTYKESDSVSGSSNYSTFSQTFTSTSTFEVRAIVFDSRNDGSHVGATTWNVTVSPLRVINFSGYTWIVKDSGDSQEGPGPNYWSDSSENVWVDADEQLHLKITNQSGNWSCAEVYSNKTFGYGEYIFSVASQVDLLDKNVVGGLFTYRYNGENITPQEYEIDIEFSTWNNTILPNNALQVFQYRTADNDSNKIPPHLFNISLNGDYSTHKFTWNDDYLHFQSYHGHYDHPPSPDYLIANTTFDNSNIPQGTDIPPESEEKVHMNLWQIKGQPPSNGKEVEIIIKKFTFLCSCSTCGECEAKLNDNSCSVVKLTADIINHSGTCIDNPANFTNKTFDCQGHVIEGNDSGDNYGIYLNGKSGNVIKNCIITEFRYGLRLDDSSNNILINNTATGNQYGIYSYGSNSTINSNFVCGNTNSDFNSTGWLSSSGDNNTCSNPDGWNDTLKTGCTNVCAITYTVNLYSGWNLVSIPITPKNTSIKSVLASVEGSYKKVGAWVNGTGKHYIPGFPFNTLNEINEEMGFWIKMNRTGTLTVEGYEPEDRKITLQLGWNLVGYLSANKTQPLASTLSSISGKYTKVGAWINGTGKHYIHGFPFNTLINMSEGYGYWIKMNASGVLEY